MPAPMTGPTRVRTAAKALVVRDGHLLAIKCHGHEGLFYILPGGGQEPGEDLHACLQRECLEEIGVEVEIGELRYVRDYVGRNHQFADLEGHHHALELMFVCTLRGEPAQGGVRPDDYQTGVEWLPIERIDEYPLMPRALRVALRHWEQGDGPIYLGDVN
jgi:ADP-ribose pyrophosphatase YjhB (NUDIX family)